MRTQSVDTHPDAERIMIELIRNSPMSKRFRLVQSLTQSAFWANVHAWQERHCGASEQEAAVHVLSYSYGLGLAQHVRVALERREGWHLQPIDLLAVMLPARRALEDLRVPYYLGGSIASSLHGMQQLVQDIDLVVDLDEQMLPSLFAALRQHYLFNEGEAREAVRARTSFPLIHLDSLMKADVVLPKPEPFDTFMHQLIRCSTLDEHYPPIPLPRQRKCSCSRCGATSETSKHGPKACRTMPSGTTSWACSKFRDRISICLVLRSGLKLSA
jgi:hypothetical protein